MRSGGELLFQGGGGPPVLRQDRSGLVEARDREVDLGQRPGVAVTEPLVCGEGRIKLVVPVAGDGLGLDGGVAERVGDPSRDRRVLVVPGIAREGPPGPGRSPEEVRQVAGATDALGDLPTPQEPTQRRMVVQDAPVTLAGGVPRVGEPGSAGPGKT